MKPNATSTTPESAKPVTEFWYGILPVALNHVLYAASLQRFRSLPTKVVHGGHYGSFDRSRMLELIDQQLADLDQYLGH